MATAAEIESLKAQIKQLQTAIQNRQFEDAANVLRLLKKVSATEELLRSTKAGLAVSKIRTCENVTVSQLSKEIVTKWKAEVDEIKKKRAAGPHNTNAPVAGASPSAHGVAAAVASGSAAGSASPAPIVAQTKSKPEPKTVASVNTSVAKASTSSRSPSVSTPASAITTTLNGGSANTGDRSFKSDGIRPTTTGEKTRDKCVEMAYDAMVFDSGAPSDLVLIRAQGIEKCCFNEFGSTDNAYRSKMRRLILNLKDKKNPSLRQGVVSGDIGVERFCNMSSEEMASEERKQVNELLNAQNLHNSLAAGEQEAETDAFQCGRCKQRKTRYRQAQTRSADEPMTTFVTYVLVSTWNPARIDPYLSDLVDASTAGTGGSSLKCAANARALCLSCLSLRRVFSSLPLFILMPLPSAPIRNSSLTTMLPLHRFSWSRQRAQGHPVE
ncbi:RNA polymerase II elongation factor [Tulasnella sp. 403]|nr:RNA polymerase II elongation factor [Tulasnella sp. 403]